MGWDNNSELLAGILDAINLLIRLTYNANSKSPDTSEIERFNRPYEEAREPETTSLADFARIINGGG